MFDVLIPLLRMLNAREWPRRFSALSGGRKSLVTIFVVLVLVTLLSILGHYCKIGVSIGPLQEGENGAIFWEMPPLAFIVIAFLDVILLIPTVYFMGHGAPGVTPRPTSAERSALLTVHAVLPADPVGGSAGDALLQAAGFLAARDAFYDDGVRIKFHDHRNQPYTAAKILRDIIEETPAPNPICIVFTMSTVCEEVARVLRDEYERAPSLRMRLSVVFTVASAPHTPHSFDDNMLQHFVTGEQEAEVIWRDCDAVRKDRQFKNPQALLLIMDSPYSDQTATLLGHRLEESGFGVTKVPFLADGQPKFPDVLADLIDKSDKSQQIAIAIAYDRALLGAFSKLNELGFAGRLLGTTTLSVPDWLEYLASKGYLPSSGRYRVWFTSIRGFDPESSQASFFVRHLAPWTFQKVTAEADVYGRDPNRTRSAFQLHEREVYQNILPNYISAYVFDSVRLFWVMHIKRLMRLADLDLSCPSDVLSEHCPFRNIRFSVDGRSHVDLCSVDLELPINVTDLAFSGESQLNRRDAVVIVDVQRDFFAGGTLPVPDAESLLPAMNATIKEAVEQGALIIFTRDWHPEDHSSFDEFGGLWPRHCVRGSKGAEFHPDLLIPTGAEIVNAGDKKHSLGYSPYEDAKMDALINKQSIRRVYVVGIALGYCVRATCLDTIERGKRVLAVEPLIRAIKVDPGEKERVWSELVGAGVIRVSDFRTVIDSHVAPTG